MDAILNFVGSDTVAAALVVAAVLVVPIAAVRLALRDMYASKWWRLQHHWDD